MNQMSFLFDDEPASKPVSPTVAPPPAKPCSWWAETDWHQQLGHPTLMTLEEAKKAVRRTLQTEGWGNYTYILWRFDAAPWPIPFYVGKGTTRFLATRVTGTSDPRLSSHEADARFGRGYNKEKEAVFRKSKIMYSVEYVKTDKEARNREEELIAFIGRRDHHLRTGPLWNHTPGGDGVTEHTPEAKARIGAASKARGIPPGMLEAAVRATKGKPLAPEHLAKIVAANKGAKRGEHIRAKYRAAWTPERKAKHGERKTAEARARYEALRPIFETLIDQGTFTQADLARRMNEAGVSTPFGKSWSQGSVQRLCHEFGLAHRLYVHDADAAAERYREVVEGLIGRGVTHFGAIATALNNQGMLTPFRKKWGAESVKHLLVRLGHDVEEMVRRNEESGRRTNSREIIGDGIRYPSIAAAARALGVPQTSISNRVRSDSKKWPGWRYAEEDDVTSS